MRKLRRDPLTHAFAASMLLAAACAPGASAPPQALEPKAAAAPTSTPAPTPAIAPARVTPEPPTTSAPPPTNRSFSVNGTAIPVDTRLMVATGAFLRVGALSPDGLILAASTGPSEVSFYDLDREVVVGHTRLPDDARGFETLDWLGDETLVVTMEKRVLILDGRTGAVRHDVSGVSLGIVATAQGPALAMLEGHPALASRPVGFRLVSAPERVVGSFVLPHPAEALFRSHPGGFVALLRDGGAAGFDAAGRLLWKVERDIFSLGIDPRTESVIWLDMGTSVLDVATGKERAELTRYARRRNDQEPPPTGVPSGVLDARLLERPGKRKLDVRRAVRQATREGNLRPVPKGDQTTRLFRRVSHGEPRGEALMLLNGTACTLLANDRGEPRLWDCEAGRWFDVRSAGVPGAVPYPIGDHGWRRKSAQTVDEPDGASFTARCGALPPATLGTPGKNATAPSRSTVPADRVSPDGTLRTSYGPKAETYRDSQMHSGTSTKIEVKRAHDGVALHTLDQGELVDRFEFHASGKLVVAGESTVKVWNARESVMERALPGNQFEFSDDGRWLFVSSARDAAIYDWNTLKPVGRWPGQFRAVAVSPTVRFAVLLQTAKVPEKLSSHVVAVHVVELASRVTRLVARSDEVGFAFSADDRTFALAPVPLDPHGGEPPLAGHLELYDLSTGRLTSKLSLEHGGERPFFMNGNAIVGHRSLGGVRLVRRADGATLDVRAFEKDGQCGIYATTPDGRFDGEPRGALGFRMGADLRTSELVVSGPLFEAKRKPGLVEAFVNGQ